MHLFFVVLIEFVKSCLQIYKTKNPGPMATPSETIPLKSIQQYVSIFHDGKLVAVVKKLYGDICTSWLQVYSLLHKMPAN